MSSKKISYLIGFVALIASSGVDAQVTPGSYNWRDSSLIPASRMAQQNEFMNNQYAYPAKPRNQWEVGVKAGSANIYGDVPSNGFNFGYGAHVRKSIGYLFSMRMEYNHGSVQGLHWQPAKNYILNPAWAGNGYKPNVVDPQGNQNTNQDPVYYNYKSNVNDFSVQGLLSLNNIRFHKVRTKYNLYLIGGVGVMWYKTNVNALNGTTKYNFANISGNATYKDRADIKKALRDLLDDSYETPADSHDEKKSRLFNGTSRFSGTLGLGLAFKITPRVNLAIEDRLTFVQDDLLDGQRWQEHPFGAPVMTRNFDSYNFLSLGLNFNLF